MTPGRQLTVDEEAASLWFELLCDIDRPGETILQAMHDVGIVSALIPEFEPCTGLVRHDLYHVYTVDQHSLYVLQFLKALRRGEHRDGFSMAHSVMAEVRSHESLYMAALLHDVGKALGRHHARKGARLARGVAARMGMDIDAQQQTEFLVRQHLLMAQISQRRDLADPKVVSTFADIVQSVE